MAGQRNKDDAEGSPKDDVPSRAPEQASRRKLMGAGASLAIGGFLPAGFAGAAAAPADAPTPHGMTPAAVLKRLQEGNARYAANQPNERDFSAERAARATAQYPVAAILSCADSRVVPDLVFDQEPGDLFVVRVAGNIVTTDLLASIEYGVEFLGAVLIVVLGHSSCGAVDAAIKVMKKDAKLPGHLPDLIRALKPAVVIAEKNSSGTLLDNAIVENVRRQVAALKRATPIIARDYASKKIDIVGGVYDIATGKVTMI
ncbi:MAG TPA: carbonic anhydrase [Casimicrobiaceae bacterium]|nr:carbonic anhydrase [Casimicrobiaceae bacterium]